MHSLFGMVMAVACFALEAIAGPRTLLERPDGQQVLMSCDSRGFQLVDTDRRPLISTTPPDGRWWSVSAQGPEPVTLDLEHLEYAVLGDGGLVASGQTFPQVNPPNTTSTLSEYLAQSSTNVALPELLPLDLDVALTVVPVQLYLEVSDSIHWQDENYFINSAGLEIADDRFYSLLFQSGNHDQEFSAAFQNLGYSLPSLWELNQNPIVSHLIPDTERCSWYGDQPGWACAPDGQPWLRNIQDTQDLSGFLASFQQQGLDLS
ncbi:MAG: hypothetical protein KC488_14585, partial [Candidatus Cloacimonetes bacterium]|nr:hypothetical protein [Candidatus Cloacimonadota bacterium]